MTRERWLHVAGLGGVLALAFLIGSVTGLWEAAGWLVVVVAVVFHASVFGALITWFVRRVRGHARDES